MFVSVLLGWSALVSVTLATYYSQEYAFDHFQAFMHKYDKRYNNVGEMMLRFEIFKNNLNLVNQMNNRSSSATFGITQFTDLTPDEFRSMYTGLIVPEELAGSCVLKTDNDIPQANVPESHDWRDSKILTRVKDQQNCGSCWAFSAVGNIESQYALKHGNLQEFSEQQLVDCDPHSHGCSGGIMSYAFESVMEKGGIEGEQDYPYTALDQKCNFNADHVKAKVVGCSIYNISNEIVLKRLLYKNGPLAIAVQAQAMQSYKGGIMDAAACDRGTINHGVLLVGYGVEGKKPYWIFKNSWGTEWGEGGYIRVERNAGNPYGKKPYWIIKNSYGTEWGEGGYIRVERDAGNPCKMINDAMTSSLVE